MCVCVLCYNQSAIRRFVQISQIMTLIFLNVALTIRDPFSKARILWLIYELFTKRNPIFKPRLRDSFFTQLSLLHVIGQKCTYIVKITMTYALYFSCRFNNSIQQLVLSVLFCLLNFPLYKNPSSGGRKRFHLLHVIEQKCKPF